MSEQLADISELMSRPLIGRWKAWPHWAAPASENVAGWSAMRNLEGEQCTGIEDRGGPRDVAALLGGEVDDCRRDVAIF